MLVRGTTPTHKFTLPFDTGIIKIVKVIYAQDDVVVLEKEGEACSCSGNTVTVKLTQEDTFKFDCNKFVQIQIRVITHDDDSIASDVECVSVAKCLDSEVLE